MPLLGVTRREFLQSVAASFVGAVAFSSCQAPAREALVESRLLMAEDTLSANDDWYATTCRQCAAGCGLIVRVVEGRAKKVEGNPDHPVNMGKSCARGQATVQAQYHPDRVRGPLQRTGATLSAIDWPAGLDVLVTRLGQGRSTVIITPPLRGTRATIVDGFTRGLGAQWLTLEPVGEAPWRAAVRAVYGQDRLPDLDLEHADYVLSFGADFLATWLSPVRFSRGYGEFRQGRTPRGHLVALEPRMSVTAASADEWVPTQPGSEGLLALSIAYALRGDPSLAAYAPEQMAAQTGVPAHRVRAIAERFAAAERPLAIGGGPIGAQTNGTQALSAILALNTLVANSALRFGPPSLAPLGQASSSLQDWQGLAEGLRAGAIQTILVLDANPLYALPRTLGVAAAWQAARPFTISLGSSMDETSAQADLVLPTHLPLEDWGDDVPEQAPPAQVLTIQQPMLRPLYDTRSPWDVLLAVAADLGHRLPWPTLEDALRESAGRLQALQRGSIQEADMERFWMRLLQHGGWWDVSLPPASISVAVAPARVDAPTFDGSEAEYPFHLLPFVHNSLGDGDAANLPWLQAAPDPLTSVSWQTWVEVNPRVAHTMGVVEGDVVALESTVGRIEVPVYVHPAAPPNVLGVPLGQGHRLGRWSANRGANPLDVLAPLVDAQSGSLAYAATRVRMTKTRRHVGLPKLEGTVPAYQLPGHEVIQISGS